MTDSHLRELERRFRASGSVDDEVAWLRARVQAGDLRESRLKLAAICGHAASGILAGEGPGERRDAWCNRIAEHGREAVERSDLAVGRHLLPCWTVAFPSDDRLEKALRVVEERLQGARSETRVEGLGRAKHDAARLQAGGYDSPAARAAGAIEYAHGLSVYAAEGSLASMLQIVLSDSCERWEGRPEGGSRWPEILAAVAREVAPWALGYSDAVRERVDEARRRKVADG
ncbi:MAG: hypothetical protein AB7N76_12655 [Planctomycetota bacterium]